MSLTWKSVKDELPVVEYPSEPGRFYPDYNWCVVTDGERRWSIARYGMREIEGELKGVWEFWDDDNLCECPYAGDSFGFLDVEDIMYWLPVWVDMPRVQ